jgi:hypothetical protein
MAVDGASVDSGAIELRQRLLAFDANEYLCARVLDFIDYLTVAVKRQYCLSGGGSSIGAMRNARLNAVVSL